MRPTISPYITTDEKDKVFGPGPATLLRLVERTGSLLSAAKAMGMSYSKATHLVKHAEERLGVTLTMRSTGGEGGGGSVLTRECQDLLDRYELWSASVRETTDDLFGAAFAGTGKTPRLGCVVMASGLGTRFGGQKLLSDLGGRPVLERTLASIPRDLFDVIVVTGSSDVIGLCERLGVKCRINLGRLQSDSVRVGIEAAGKALGCMFAQGDQPLVRPESMRALAFEFARDPHRIVRLAFGDQAASPVIFPAWLFGSLASLVGDVGGLELLRRSPDLSGLVSLVQAQDASELEDIDTREDSCRLEQILSLREG